MKQNIKQNEKIKAQEFKKFPPKLKGHATIQLFEDGREVERIEEDNLVTDAVATIFASQFFGNGDLRALTPTRNLYGGIYAFQNSMEESASNVRPPSQNANPLIAHAGQESHSTESPYRGNPNAIESGPIQNGRGYKFVWDWNTSQGNGTIGALALTMSRFGNTGLISSDANQSALLLSSMAETIKGPEAASNYTRDRAIKCPISYNPDTGEGIAAYATSTTLEFIKVRANSAKFYLNDSVTQFEEVESHVVNLSSSKSVRYSGLIEDANYYYYICIPNHGGTSAQIDKIDKTDYSVTPMNLNISGASLYRYDANSNWAIVTVSHPLFSSDGRFLYLPSTDYSFYRIEISNTANVTKLNSNLTRFINSEYNRPTVKAVAVSEQLIVGFYYIINGDNVTSTNIFTPAQGYYAATSIADANRYPAFVLRSLSQTSSGYATPTGPVILPYLATINNLASTVTKTPSHTMKITYTLTQAEE